MIEVFEKTCMRRVHGEARIKYLCFCCSSYACPLACGSENAVGQAMRLRSVRAWVLLGLRSLRAWAYLRFNAFFLKTLNYGRDLQLYGSEPCRRDIFSDISTLRSSSLPFTCGFQVYIYLFLSRWIILNAKAKHCDGLKRCGRNVISAQCSECQSGGNSNKRG